MGVLSRWEALCGPQGLLHMCPQGLAESIWVCEAQREVLGQERRWLAHYAALPPLKGPVWCVY